MDLIFYLLSVNEIAVIVLIVVLYFSPVIYQLILVVKESKRGNKLPLKKLLKFLWLSITILVVIVIFGITLNHTNYLSYQSPMTFDQYEEITFDDFKGLELFKKSLFGNERFAYVVTTIETELGENHAEIRALFHPSRSFVYNSKTDSKELLKHEKYHFKITELFVRKAKSEISQLNISNKKSVSSIIDRVRQQERSYQSEYDKDTYHSYILSKQKEYEREIDSLLSLFSDFKEPRIKFNDDK